MISYLLDVSYCLYRGHYSAPDRDYFEVTYILNKVKSCLKKGPVYLCVDGRNPKGRILNENYKSNRVHDYNVYRKLPGLLYSLSGLNNVKIKFNDSLEADEVLYSLTRLLGGKKVIITGDNDLLQSLNSDVSIERGKDLITEDYYLQVMDDKFYSIPPRLLPVYRALVGDTSDNLKPPVYRFPHKLAAFLTQNIEFTEECPSLSSLEKVKDLLDKKSEKAWVDKLIAEYPAFCKNYSIMKLNVYTDIDNTPDLCSVEKFTVQQMSLIKDIRLMDKVLSYVSC